MRTTDPRDKIRRPRRRRPVFDWKRKRIEVMFEEPHRFKTVEAAQCIGDFGYHKTLGKLLPGVPKWTVSHLPTGLSVKKVETEKDAKILTKRLFTEVKTRWTPTREESLSYLRFHEEAAGVINKYNRSQGVLSEVVPNYQAHTCAPEDYDDDIPF